jgi:hypothetical protein
MKTFTLCSLLLAFVYSNLYAQQKTTFGIQAGVNRATSTNANKSVTQFSGGLLAVFPVSNETNLQTGVFYQGKGLGNEYLTYRNHIRINYLQVPLYLNYRLKLKPGHVYLGAGPYVAVALSGRYKSEVPQYYVEDNYINPRPTGSYEWNKYSSKLIIGKKQQYQDMADYNTQRMEYGFTGHAGLILNNGLFLNGEYDLGVANTAYQPAKRRLRTANFSVGYFF